MTKPNPLIWTAIIAATASFGSYALACVFPFAALATSAALTLPRWQALGLVTAVWSVNQLVGFTLMNYSADSWPLGLSLLAGSLAGVGAAWLTPAARIGAPRSLLPLAAAFIAYQAVTAAFAYFLGGFGNYTAQIIAGVGLNDLGWFFVLSGLYRLLARDWSQSTAEVTRGT